LFGDTVGLSADSEFVEGKGSVVTGWGKMRRGGEGMGKEWMKGGRKSSWEGEQWILQQEKEGE
jgi:hypothetical protein